jgi:hypothetical protein
MAPTSWGAPSNRAHCVPVLFPGGRARRYRAVTFRCPRSAGGMLRYTSERGLSFHDIPQSRAGRSAPIHSHIFPQPVCRLLVLPIFISIHTIPPHPPSTHIFPSTQNPSLLQPPPLHLSPYLPPAPHDYPSPILPYLLLILPRYLPLLTQTSSLRPHPSHLSPIPSLSLNISYSPLRPHPSPIPVSSSLPYPIPHCSLFLSFILLYPPTPHSNHDSLPHPCFPSPS